MFEYSTMDYPCKVLERIKWGAHINSTNYPEVQPKYPDWLNPFQKHVWRDRGLVVWDATIQLVVHLYANYALKILETMKRAGNLKTNGFVIGSPVYRMSIPDTKKEQTEATRIECPPDGWVLINQITLSFEQAEELLGFLVTEEHTLILIAAEEDRDVHEAYAMVVDMVLERRRKKREPQNFETREDSPRKKIIPISIPKGTYLTIPQMAEICDVPLKQIKTWIRSGDIDVIDLPGAGQIVEIENFTKFLNGNGKTHRSSKQR